MGKSGDDGGGDPGGGIGGGSKGGGGGGRDPGIGSKGGGGPGGGGDPGAGGGGGDPGAPGGVGGGGDPGGVGAGGDPGGPDPGSSDPGTTDSKVGAADQTQSVDALGAGSGAGPGASAALSGGGYGDPLAASDPSNVLSASRGDLLGPEDAGGGAGDPFAVEGAPGQGAVPPTDRASQGDMLDPATRSLADQSAAEDTASEELLGPQDYGPGTQQPTGEFRDAPTPGPAMSPGTEQADTLAGQQFAELGQSDVPLDTEIAQKFQEQAPGAIPGGVGSTEDVVPAASGASSYPIDFGGYADQPAPSVIDPGAATRYDAANPPAGGFGGYAPGGLFTGADAGLLATGAPIGTGADPKSPAVARDENAALQTRLGQADDLSAADLAARYGVSDLSLLQEGGANQPAPFTSFGGGGPPPLPASTALDIASQYGVTDLDVLQQGGANQPTGLYGAGTGAPRLPADTGNNQMLAPGAIDLNQTFPQDYTPTQQEIAAQYGNTGLGGFQNLMAGGGAPPTAAEQVANRFPEGPGPDLNRPFFQSLPDAPSFQLPGTLTNDPNALTPRTAAEQVQARFPTPESDLGPKTVTPEIVRAPGAPDTAPPSAPGTQSTGPVPSPGQTPETPGLPSDTGGGRAPVQAPSDALGGGAGIAGLGGDQIPRGQFERGPPSNLPPPPQVVNAMLSNASPAIQQAAQSLSPAQQTQVTQFAFGLINQYRQMLENQGGVADPSSPVWQQQILPQVRSQTQQFVLQLTGRQDPQVVNQIISSAA